MSTNDAAEYIRIDNVDICLATVPSDLRRQYEHATLIVTSTPANSPQRNLAKSHLNKVAAAVLVAMAPTLALKASPRSYGAAGFFQAMNRR
jgi:hypothetical protein